MNYLARGIDRTVDGSLIVRPKSQQLLPGMTEPDVLYTIQTLPGIQSTEETVSNINIRGGTNDQNLVLWEGIRMFQTGHFFGLISAFNPHFNDKIEITKNGTSASYGNGVSGMIDMQSEDNILKKVTGSAGIGLNMINGDINLGIPISKKSSLKISSRRSITDVIRTPTFNRYFDRVFENTDVLTQGANNVVNTDDKFYFYDVSTRFIHNPSERDNFSFSFLNIVNKLDFEETEILTNTSETKTSLLDQKSIAGGFDYIRNWSSNFSTKLSSSISNYNLNAVNYDLPNDQKLTQENDVLNYNLRVSSKISTSIGSLNIGYEFDEIGIKNLEDINNPDFRREIKEVLVTHSGFVENEISVRNTNFRTGIRANYYRHLDTYLFEPRLVFNQQIVPGLSLELLGEQKSQSVAQVIDLQTDFLGVEKRRWILSNSQDVPIIKSKNLSLGVHYKKQRMLLSLEGYIREVDGIITSSQGFLNQFELVRESGSYLVKGLEFLITYSHMNFTTWLNCTHSINDYSFENLSPTGFPNNMDIRNTISAGVSYENGPLLLSLGASNRSGRPITAIQENAPILNNSINYLSPNNARLKNYFRVDVSAGYRFDFTKKVKGQLGISFWNITNNENLLNQYYRLDGSTINQIDQQALELTPNMIFRVTF